MTVSKSLIETIVLDPFLGIGTSPFVVQAFRIHVPKNVFSAPGAQVTLLAHEIIFDDGAVIDVSGSPGAMQLRAGPGQNPGDNGANGVATSAQNGGNGGSITLIASQLAGSATLRADGGAGAPGQHGGDGAAGVPGAPGKRTNDGTPGSPGGRGGNGGNAGNGGNGGNGGAGGTIQVFCTETSKSDLHTSVVGGTGGTRGDPGALGAAGAAGANGGNWIYPPPIRVEIGGPPTWEDLGTLGPGNPGTASSKGQNGNAGVAGSVQSIADAKTVANKFQTSVDNSFMALLLSHAEESYYNGDIATGDISSAASVLGWLSELIPPPGGSTASASSGQIGQRAAVLISQLKAGTDYYGHPRNYVQSLSVLAYEQANQTIVNSGINLSTALAQYRNERQVQATRMAAFNASISSANSQITSNANEVQQLLAQANSMETQLDNLLSQQLDAYSQVLTASDALKAAVEAGGGGCSFAEIMSAAGLVITIATGIPATAVSIATAADAAIAPFRDGVTLASIKTRITDIQTVSGDFSKFFSQYNQLKAMLGHAPDPSFEGTKFLLSSSDFNAIRAHVEQQVSGLPNSPEKNAYMDAVNGYLQIAQNRNQQLVAFDGLQYRMATINARTDDLRASVYDLTTQATIVQTQDVSGLVDQLAGVQDGLLKDAYYFILQQSRALDYWTLLPSDPPRQVADFNALSGILGGLTARRIQAEQALNNPPSQLTSLPAPLRITLTNALRTSLQNTGRISFAIGPDDPSFASFAQVLVDQVRVLFARNASISDPQPVAPINYSLQHSGYHVFRDVNRVEFDFVTRSRTVIIATDANGVPVTMGSFSQTGAQLDPSASVYVGVSPFTVWDVAVNNAAAVAKQIEDVVELQLQFSGTVRPFTFPPQTA